MKISGQYTIDAPREQVWEALNDIEVLARVVPGCQRLEQTGEHEYEGTVKIGIQSIKGTYNGRIRIEDIRAPEHYRLVASGRGSNGVVDGAGTVDLSEQDGRTLLEYRGDANIGGTLASVGQRLIDAASRQLLNQSLKALAEQVAARGQAAPPAAEQPAVEQPAAAVSAAAAQASPPPATAAPEADVPVQPPEPPQHPQRGAALNGSAPAQPPAPPQRPAPRAVELAEHEQLRPEAVLGGVVADFVRARPWLPWVIVAFLLGVLYGRARD